MQNKIIRFILDLDPRSHIGSDKFKKVNMLPVEYRVKQLKLNHTFKIFNNQGPKYLQEHFKTIKDNPINISTRASKNNFFKPSVKGQAINTFYFSAIKEWNSLPSKIKEISNFISFKSAVKNHLETELINKELNPYVY